MEGYIIFIDENIPYLKDALRGCGKVYEFNGRELGKADLSESGCNILFTRSTTQVGPELLEGSNVRFVGSATSGTDHVNLPYLRQMGIAFSAAPGSNANSVAEYVVYSALKYLKNTGKTPGEIRTGVVGFGNIGQLAAVYLNYLGMEVLVNDPPLEDEAYQFPGYVKYAGLKEIFKKCDIITNHTPLTKDGPHPTLGLIGEEETGLMKPGGLIIHTSRGGVASEAPLLEKIRGYGIYAAIDTWENEPLINIDLAKAAMIATPHVAGYSRDGKLKGVLRMAEEFERFSGLKAGLDIIFRELHSYSPMHADDFKNPDFIYNKLKDNRRFDEDSDKLLKSLELNGPERKEEFDKQRKNYPERRESL